MHNDSIETLLLRHYSNAGPTPPAMEQRIVASVRLEAQELRRQERIARNWRSRPVSRRSIIKLVTLGSAGLGVVSIGLEGLRSLESALVGQDTTQPAVS
ncbi:MAG TPA: hypothetical protein VFB60_04925 [Ktedonobacteraceae bacterium]|nr:hypothetical protein [Ktedonobacteraceae bacterium]